MTVNREAALAEVAHIIEITRDHVHSVRAILVNYDIPDHELARLLKDSAGDLSPVVLARRAWWRYPLLWHHVRH